MLSLLAMVFFIPSLVLVVVLLIFLNSFWKFQDDVWKMMELNTKTLSDIYTLSKDNNKNITDMINNIAKYSRK